MIILSPAVEAFMVVAECGTVHAAATVLCLTQTAVTQRIKKLEMQAGVSLFMRSRRGMQLTQEGEVLLRACMVTQELEVQTAQTLQGVGETVDVAMRVTASSSLAQSRLMPACTQFRSLYPHVLVHIDVLDTGERVDLLKSGACDVALIEPEHVAADMQMQLLQPEQYVLVCSATWSKRTLEDIIAHERIIDFEPQDQITFSYLKQYGLYDAVLPGRLYVNRTEILADMVARGLGYSTLAKEFVAPYLSRYELQVLNHGQAYDYPVALAWYDRPSMPAYLQRFLQLLG